MLEIELLTTATAQGILQMIPGSLKLEELPL